MPEGTYGVIALNNGDPTSLIGDEHYHLYLSSRTDKSATFSRELNILYNAYMGCIVSPSGEILWVNNTRPLP